MNSPNPKWQPGDKIQVPFSGMVDIDPEIVAPADMYKLLIGSVVPRPIAFVSTVSAKGAINLAPFSFFNGISSNPACVVISVTRKANGEKKDTWRNIEETREFVVNSANEWLAEPLVHTAGAFPYGVDEMAKVGLTSLPSIKIKPPRVKESAVQFECELYKTLEIGDGSPGSATLIVGKIVLAHVAKEAYTAGRIDFNFIRPIARLGGVGYGKVVESFELAPPKV